MVRDTLHRILNSGRLAYQHGDHVCAFYSSPEELLAASIEFTHDALNRGARCFHLCCEPFDAIRGALRRSLVDAEAEERRGALIFACNDSYLQGGAFDPDRSLAFLET